MCEKTQGTIIMTIHDVDPTGYNRHGDRDEEGEQRGHDTLAGQRIAPEQQTPAPDVYQIPTPPKSPEGHKWAVRAGAGALTLALAAGGFFGVKAMSGDKEGPAPSKPVATAPAVPGQTEQSQPTQSATEVPKTSRNPEGLSAENYPYQFKGETVTQAEFVDRLLPSVEDYPDPKAALEYIVTTSFNVCSDGGATPADLQHKSYNPDNNAGPGPDALQRDMYGPACATLFENTNGDFATKLFTFNRNEARMKGITNNQYKGSWEFGGVVQKSTNADGPVQMHSVIYYNNNYAEAQPQVLVDENDNIPPHATTADAFTLDKKNIGGKEKWVITDVADSPVAANSELAQKYN
jgi:hypothetical protein